MPISLIPGDIIKVFLSSTNPPKEKFVAVMSVDDDHFRAFCINTDINANMAKMKAFRDAQIRLLQTDYPFFTEPVSHLSCWELHSLYLHEIEADFLNHSQCGFKGHLLDTHKKTIQHIISSDDSYVSPYEADLIIQQLGHSYALLNVRNAQAGI